MKKVRFLFFIMMLSVVLFSCADSLNENEAILPDSYKEKLGTSGDDDDRYKQGEGAYIKDDPWSHGEITYDNYKSGEIWSFDVEKGQTYSIFMLNDSIKLHGYKYECELSCYKGSSKTEFDATAMQGVKNDFWYQHQYQGYSGENDLYSSPAVITATESGTVFLKIIPTHIDMETTSFNQTLPYSICVRKGRTEDSYVPLKCYGIPYSAWQHGELLFAIPNGWHDYIENTDSNWIDGYWYSVNVTKGVKYTLFIDEKGKSGNFTAQTTVNIVYYDAENNLQNVLPADYEYANNDGYREGYPFVAPITGTVLFAVYPENNAASNIGTFRLAVGTEDSYAPLSLDSWTYKYQYKPKNTSLLRVGRLFQPGTDFELKMYNGTTIPAEAITQWGWNSSTLTRWDTYLLCKEAGQSYLYCTYNGEDYYCNFTVAEKGSQTASFRIELPSAENFAVGNSISLKAKNGNSDITNSVTWKYADASSPDSDLKNLTSGAFPCEEEGEYYLFALYNDEIVFEKITVLPASSNPYNLALASGSLELFGSATFKLTKNGTDVSSSATWSCNDESVEFDAGTASFYGAGKQITITAIYDGVIKTYKASIADKSVYNINFSMPFAKISFGSSYSSYTIKLSGVYDQTKFETFVSKIKSFTKTFTLDMSDTTNIAEMSGTSSTSGIFSNCYRLTNLILPSCLTKIGDYAFVYSYFSSISLPSQLAEIGKSAFCQCPNLTGILIPNTVVSIDTAAFSYCAKLTSINLSSALTKIPNQFLQGCTQIASVTLPSNVTEIGSSAFYNCSKLNNFTIPKSVQKIGYNAFYGCSSLTSVDFEQKTSWWQTSSSTYVNGSSVLIKTASENAKFLKNTYSAKYWYRNNTLSVNKADSLYVEAFYDIYLQNTEEVFTFAGKANYVYVVRFDKASEHYSGKGELAVTKDSETVISGTYDFFNSFVSSSAGTYTITIKKEIEGFVGVRIFEFDNSVTATNYGTIQTRQGSGAYLNDIKNISVDSSTAKFYSFNVISGYDYTIDWRDKETVSNSTTYKVDGHCLIFNPSRNDCWEIDNNSKTINPAETGTYLLVLQANSSGTVGFQIYKTPQ